MAACLIGLFSDAGLLDRLQFFLEHVSIVTVSEKEFYIEEIVSNLQKKEITSTSSAQLRQSSVKMIEFVSVQFRSKQAQASLDQFRESGLSNSMLTQIYFALKS